jgi:phenylalanine-4-hydroxylase
MERRIIDADDFCEENSGLYSLVKIKEANKDFKITLFTIVGRCSMGFIEEIKKFDWIEMVPHGWMHETSRECENWTLKECEEYLDEIEKYGLVKGFKAPGWQISQDMYFALKDRGYWVADQGYNNERRPKMRNYIHKPTNLHYHIGHMGGHNANEIGGYIDFLSELKGDFKFISEIV